MMDGIDGPGFEGAPIGPEDLFSMAQEGEFGPQEIAQRLVLNEGAFVHLRAGEAKMLFLMREMPKEKGGKSILGEMTLPRFSGPLGQVGTWLLARVCDGLPDFIMLLDSTWWVQASPLQREALVFHEMCHAIHAVDRDGELKFDGDGNPIWALRSHDLEEFNAVVERYGAWLPDVTGFAAALRKGGVL